MQVLAAGLRMIAQAVPPRVSQMCVFASVVHAWIESSAVLLKLFGRIFRSCALELHALASTAHNRHNPCDLLHKTLRLARPTSRSALFSAILQHGSCADDSASQGGQSEKGRRLDRSLGGLGGGPKATQALQEEGVLVGVGASFEGWHGQSEVFDAQLEGALAFASNILPQARAQQDRTGAKPQEGSYSVARYNFNTVVLQLMFFLLGYA